MGEEVRILSIHPCGISRIFYIQQDLTTWEIPALLPIREEGVLRIFIALKNPLPLPGSNPQPLGPVASTLITTPPRRLRSRGAQCSVWLRTGRPGDRGFYRRQRQETFPLTSVSRPARRPTQPPVQWVPGVLSRGKARPGRDADHSPPSSAEFRNK
jgi:hypothetical protein